MRFTRVVAAIAALIAGLVALPSHDADAATLPSFPMALPVGWGSTVQAGGAHTHSDGTRSSVDLGASGGLSVPVVAAADGVVTVKGAGAWSRCYVVIEHADGWQTQYYHLKAIPAGLSNGARVKAGDKIGMTGMPGSETCGRGTFRHVHFGLYRNGVEQNISGISLGGYRYTSTGGSYCGYWTRERDGVIVADARRACLAVPAVANNQVHPSDLVPRGISALAVLSGPRPVISRTDTIAPSRQYVTPGEHSVSQRAWRTRCEAYGAGRRCFTDIWATQVRKTGTTFALVEGWAFNNLTYIDLTRDAWGTHNFAATGTFTVDGRQWRTECGTAATGPDGCRSFILSTIYVPTRNSQGRYDVAETKTWVFNHQVWFARRVAPAASAARTVTPSAQVVAPVADDPTPTPTPAPLDPTPMPTIVESPLPVVTADS